MAEEIWQVWKQQKFCILCLNSIYVCACICTCMCIQYTVGSTEVSFLLYNLSVILPFNNLNFFYAQEKVTNQEKKSSCTLQMWFWSFLKGKSLEFIIKVLELVHMIICVYCCLSCVQIYPVSSVMPLRSSGGLPLFLSVCNLSVKHSKAELLIKYEVTFIL